MLNDGGSKCFGQQPAEDGGLHIPYITRTDYNFFKHVALMLEKLQLALIKIMQH